jgi:hypothetical protein
VRGSGSAPRPSRAGAALLVSILVFVGLKYLGTVNAWKQTHWLFSYELGFVKRGLVGTLFQGLHPSRVVYSEAIVVTSLAVVALFLVALGAFAYPLFSERQRQRSLAIALVALLAPGVGYLVSDLGRFDVMNLTLCLVTLLGVQALGRFPAVLLVAVSCVLLLIHEAALVLCLPLLFVAYLESEGRLEALANRRQWLRLAPLLAPVGLLFVALVGLGSSDRPAAELIASLAAQADFEPSTRSAYVLLRPLGSNVAQVFDAGGAVPEVGGSLPLGSVDTLSFWHMLALAALQQVFAHFAFAGLAPVRRRAVRLALHGSFLAPLALMIVGVDWGRWVAGGSAQCAVLMLLFARGLPEAVEGLVRRNFVIATALVLVVAAGSGIPLQGARRGFAISPQAGVMTWLQDHRASKAWYEAFVPSPGPRGR